MTEREFLERRSERIRARLSRRSETVHDEIERALGPVVRDHPRKSVAAAAVAGVALGAALKPASRAASGATTGLFGFLRKTAGYALRARLVGALSSKDDGGEETAES